ncbi:DUF7344 domain-containing protein [Natrononativus amylolyticus]|uniref:DUF7344 domain-containing protein n=1 Tax=Natrononativus amylolyticus TaxID=2963434 RepID=UPI0020CC330C|nr:hypothetical protein [Natrononativus amylolyticus]
MTDTDLSQAELFDVFSNARRRYTVQYLKRQNGSCDLAPLVEQVAAWENETAPDQVTRAQRRRVYISLYQTHLPMLEDHEIVEWDADGHSIELLPTEETFDPYLDRHADGQRSWHYLYATLALTAGLALVVSWLAVTPLTVESAPLVALALCGSVLAVAVAQYLSRSSVRFPVTLTRR